MTTRAILLDKVFILCYNQGWKVKVHRVTKDYVIVDGEKIYFDEPFDEEPDKESFEKWLRQIESLLETLFCSRATDETIHTS